MHLTPLFSQLAGSNIGIIVVASVALVIVIFIFLAIWAGRYTKVGPNQVLVVSGRKHTYRDPDGTIQSRGFRIVKGGGTFVIPVVEKVDLLSLELLTIDVQTPEVYTSKGVPVRVDGVAQIAQAEADRDAMIRSSQATQAGQEAKFAADTKIAEAQRDYQMNVATYQASVNLKKAEADLAYDLQKYKTGQLVKAEEIQVSIIEKQKQIELQQQEILRKQRELEANVQKPADAERYRVETLANATKFQLETEAAGAASAAKAKGFAAADVAKATGIAEAEANKARGLAEAAIIQAQGKATAEAMLVKAESFKQYNEAAVIEMIIRILPDVAGKISEPLSRTEKMVIINSGNGVGGGASKLTGDVTQIVAQLPPISASLTGIKFETLLQQVPALRKSMGKEEPKELPKRTGVDRS